MCPHYEGDSHGEDIKNTEISDNDDAEWTQAGLRLMNAILKSFGAVVVLDYFDQPTFEVLYVFIFWPSEFQGSA